MDLSAMLRAILEDEENAVGFLRYVYHLIEFEYEKSQNPEPNNFSYGTIVEMDHIRDFIVQIIIPKMRPILQREAELREKIAEIPNEFDFEEIQEMLRDAHEEAEKG